MRLALLFSISLFCSGALIGCGGGGGGNSNSDGSTGSGANTDKPGANGDTPSQGNENGEADWDTASWDEFSWQ